ncbi:MAG TPA: hypothetical protein DCL54_02510 [Alphaproteobacteria bacterium]|nr:hypothetical protein [Alphaproteobacteria bacterium]HAJ45438.1 hypothetical protein [Alphaproteobacteria bacterium]
MSASDIAAKHFAAAMADVSQQGTDPDAVARQFLSLIIKNFLERRPVQDVRAELLTAADNVDPGTDYMFMRP